MSFSQYYMVDMVDRPSVVVAHDEPIEAVERLSTIEFRTTMYNTVATFPKADVRSYRSVTKEIAHAEIAHRQRMEMRASDPIGPLRSSLMDQMFGERS